MKWITNIIIVILCVLAVYLLITENIKYSADKKLIFSDYAFAKGHMIDFDNIGDIGTRYLEYEYTVDSITYTNRVVCSKNYDKCVKELWRCSHIKFWVMYSVKEPSKSLIDYSREVQNDTTINYPTDFSKFK